MKVYGKLIILETEPDQQFLGFMLEHNRWELIYNGPTNISQVLSPYSGITTQCSPHYFRSGATSSSKAHFQEYRVSQGLVQLIQLYTMAGFPNEELTQISSRILDLHQAEKC